MKMLYITKQSIPQKKTKDDTHNITDTNKKKWLMNKLILTLMSPYRLNIGQ